MNFIEKIIYGLSGEMPTPTMYGWFHLVALALIIALTVFLCWKGRDCSAKAFKWIIASAWIVMVVFEIYKQVVFAFNYDGTKVTWDYEWYAFPFQLCSTPLYVFPFIAFLRGGKFRDSLIAFAGSFVLFGGLSTILFPATVFIPTIGINIQTMVHHGLQVVIGIFILVHERRRLNIKFFLKGILVFVAMFAIAMAMNFIVHACISETFNMFYISPYFPCVIPLLDMVYDGTPYVVFLLIYLIGFLLVAFVMYLIVYGFIKLGMRRKSGQLQDE